MKFKSKKIYIFTTNRADYGLLKRFILICKSSKYLKPILVVSGSHLEKKFGYTFNEIKNDNYIKYTKVFTNISGDQPIHLSNAMAKGLKSFSKILHKKKPDLIVVLGDRIELIPICYSALLFNVPIAHFNGGELTEGLMDDAIRHSITKLSHIHFVANETYRKRLINMGENPQRVFNVGGTSVDNIKYCKLINKKKIQQNLNLKFKKKNFLVTYHPVTLNIKSSINEIQNLLKALSKFEDHGIIITGTNIDPNNGVIKNKILKFCKDKCNVNYFESVGHTNYLSLIKHCDVVIGNSSSGILEAPFFKKPVVNVGNRQGGRLKSKNIISCKSSYVEILKAINIANSDKFSKNLKKFKTFYGDGNASTKVVKILEKINLNNILVKKFYEKK
jgi:GDP/UDP-N,N'-diacetylbacillosamine 2-epimerase (hydrolysing)